MFARARVRRARRDVLRSGLARRTRRPRRRGGGGRAREGALEFLPELAGALLARRGVEGERAQDGGLGRLGQVGAQLPWPDTTPARCISRSWNGDFGVKGFSPVTIS